MNNRRYDSCLKKSTSFKRFLIFVSEHYLKIIISWSILSMVSFFMEMQSFTLTTSLWMIPILIPIFPIQNITRERERDNIYLVKIDDHECLIGIEHQSQIDRSMFQRTREYDETHDITVSHEIAISLAALTKNTQIYEKVKEKKIDMCQAIRDYGKENLRIGKKRRYHPNFN